jgi:hypothetical protein
MWAVIGASTIGTSHEQLGTPCQDAHEVLRVKSGDDDLLLIAIADGAGSASHSQIGSAEAVRHLIALVAETCPALKEVTKEVMRGWMEAVLNHLKKVCEREGVSIGQLACTLLMGIVSKNEAVFGQIGDGAWVVEKEAAWIAATWPQNGEYVNVTTFLTTDGALDTLQFERVQGNISAVAGFTDGIQTLALNFGARLPHQPFFSPMFVALRSCKDETELIAPLQKFLASDSVTSRTDDDKTLVVAWWREQENVEDGSV